VGESPLFYCTKEMSVIAKEEIVAKIAEIAERVAEPEGIEIVEVQLAGGGPGPIAAHLY
jgi:ribosome maturation factor RimP